MSSKASRSGAEVIAGCVSALIILLLVTTMSGLIIFYGWNLVLAALFSLPEITLLQAILIGLMIGLLRGGRGHS